MPWLALTVEAGADTAEALSEALMEAGAHSVTLEEASPGWSRQRLVALLDAGASAASVLAHAAACAGLALPAFTTRLVADEDWVRASQAQFQPFQVGEALWVGPRWLEPPRSARAALHLDPGLAFGTGSHPTTRLVLRELVARVRGGERVLDYGCGSGILAIAAAKLGAGPVDAVDIDPQAVVTAAENAAANDVAVRCLAADALPDERYDIVVANILAQPLIVLAPLLAARTRRGGRLALSGILATQADEVGLAYAPFFGPMDVEKTEEQWALLTGVRQ